MANSLKKHYIERYGSIKGYLFLLMQISVIIAIVISIVCIVSKNNYYIVLEFFPLGLLIYSLKRFKEKFKKDFLIYSGIFSAFFIAAIIAPFFIQIVRVSNPFMTIRYLIFALIGLVVLFLVFRVISMGKNVVGKVLLADKESAVVQLDFDLLAGIKAGKYVVVNKKAKKNDKVIVSMKRSFWTTKPEKIKNII